MAWLSGWGYRKKITIDYTKVDSDLTDFPVVVIRGYSDTDFWSHCSSRENLTFTKSDGTTELLCEAERFDHTNDNLEIHVKVDAVSSSSPSTEIYMYYDSESPTHGKSDSTNTWDSNFKAVYHMKDDPDASHIKDSTVNANHGTKAAVNEPIECDGKVGRAQDFDGVNDYINCGTDPSVLPDVFTVETWGKTTEVQWGTVIAWSTVSYPAVHFPWAVSRTLIYLGSANFRYFGNTPVDILDGQFHHVAFTVVGNEQYDIDNARVLADGQEQTYVGGNNTGLPSVKDRLWIGRPNIYGFKGALDEIRISNIVRSDAWLKTTYNNQSSPSAFYSVGGEEIPEAPPPQIKRRIGKYLGWITREKKIKIEIPAVASVYRKIEKQYFAMGKKSYKNILWLLYDNN